MVENLQVCRKRVLVVAALQQPPELSWLRCQKKPALCFRETLKSCRSEQKKLLTPGKYALWLMVSCVDHYVMADEGKDTNKMKSDFFGGWEDSF